MPYAIICWPELDIWGIGESKESATDDFLAGYDEEEYGPVDLVDVDKALAAFEHDFVLVPCSDMVLGHIKALGYLMVPWRWVDKNDMAKGIILDHEFGHTDDGKGIVYHETETV